MDEEQDVEELADGWLAGLVQCESRRYAFRIIRSSSSPGALVRRQTTSYLLIAPSVTCSDATTPCSSRLSVA